MEQFGVRGLKGVLVNGGWRWVWVRVVCGGGKGGGGRGGGLPLSHPESKGPVPRCDEIL